MRRRILVLAVVLAAASAAGAASPPALLNYQGVLRDASDKPRDGMFDMVFRFLDASSVEILLDYHTQPANQVQVSNGLFTVALGGGIVSDGSGPGTYTSLSDVFRDYGNVWMEVQVNGETLAPRIPIRAAAYSLNAGNLQGMPASSFVDLSSAGQTKAGSLTSNQGFIGYNNSGVNQGYGVFGRGAQGGGRFESTSYSGIGQIGYGDYGIYAGGNTAGGYFYDSDSSARTSVAVGDYGIDAKGSAAGGYFHNSGSDWVSLAHLSGVAVSAKGTMWGGSFSTVSGFGDVKAADGDWGVYASGAYPGGGGGYFYDLAYSGAAWLGVQDLGVHGEGLQAGGHFHKPGTSTDAWLSGSNGTYENAVYAISNGYYETPGYFVDNYWGAYAYVGAFGTKIWGSGTVNFVQNDPADPSRVVTYTAPEGDEVAVYTRGTAQLENGIARVALGPTFRKVANPEIGLTATVTAVGEPVALAIVSKSTVELVVRGPEGSNAKFDYAVWGLRIGFEDRPVVEPKRQEAFIPSKEMDQRLLASHPELGDFTARARFAKMDAATGSPGNAAAGSGAATALESAIHVYDRTTDLDKLPRGPSPVRGTSPQHRAPDGATDAPSASRSSVTSSPTVRSIGATPMGLPQATPSLPTFPSSTIPVSVAETVESGDVISADLDHRGEAIRAVLAADPVVLGIVAGDAGQTWSGTAPLALAGSIVTLKVEASAAPIAAGDLLVSSTVRGYAMRAGENPKPGTVVAKALEPLETASGTIRVLVMSR